VSDPRALPQVVADFWAGVSAEPPEDAEAQQQVLEALAAEVPCLSADAAATLGAAEVRIGAIRKALKDSPSGKSPGVDGLPIEAYRKVKGVVLPLLSALFTAVGRTGQLPPGFLLGAVSLIYKAGSRVVAAKYRPITLLNTDYRLLGKVLATRLGQALKHHIGREQAAFLPGRRIGENVHALQTLPHYLCQLRRAALIVFCDFRKAYDTISRPFLRRCMETLGVGPGFLTWFDSLYTSTSSLAVVNGFLSRPVPFHAGVRQGCPLAPLLYLFIGQALLSWLKRRGLGLRLPGQDPIPLPWLPPPAPPPDPTTLTLTALQYADDTEAFLESPQQVPAFLAAMDVFRRASGQALNPSKCEVLPIGTLPSGEQGAAWRTPTMHGLRVVRCSAALGVTFSNVAVENGVGAAAQAGTAVAASPGANWPELLGRVTSAYSKVQRLGLSMFGRAFACAGYGISKLLYHAEHAGMPPPDVLHQLQQHTRLTIDCNRLLGVRGTQPPGPEAELLVGHPRDGGFGMLSWREHILARHAVWGCKLLWASRLPPTQQPPWARLVIGSLREQGGSHTVLPHPFSMLAAPDLWAVHGPVPSKVQVAFSALPPILDLSPDVTDQTSHPSRTIS
jgi:hypothetical protein